MIRYLFQDMLMQPKDCDREYERAKRAFWETAASAKD